MDLFVVNREGTRELWNLNTRAIESAAAQEGPGGHTATLTGVELMQRTDTSPERRESANREQAERREEMRRTGGDKAFA